MTKMEKEYNDLYGDIPRDYEGRLDYMINRMKLDRLKEPISQYIEKYPSNIRVLGYKNKEVLEKFIKKVNNENISLL